MRNRILVIAVLASASTRVAHAQLKSAVLKPLDQAAMAALAPKVRSIRAEPSTITLKVGKTMNLDAIAVVVVDSAGHDRGRLQGFDFGIPPGSAASAVPRTITGVRAGTAVLTIHYPRNAWTARKDPRPAATVKVDIKP